VRAHDGTHGLLVDGIVRLVLPGPGDPAQVGAVTTPYRWLRCRAISGSPDAAPVLRALAANAVVVAQRMPVTSQLTLAAHPSLPPLTAGERRRLTFAFDAAGDVTAVHESPSADVPKVRVVTVTPQALEVELVVAGTGLGIPELELDLPTAPVANGAIALWSGADRWHARDDFDAAGPRERSFTLDAQTGVLRFGDGERGLAPRAGTVLLASYRTTLGAAGNVAAPTWTSPVAVTPTAVGPAAGGADAEDLPHATGRASATLWAHELLLELAAGRDTLDGLGRAQIVASPAPARAATALDFERLALGVPGTRVARARCWPAFDAGAPGLSAPGTVTVVVVNTLPRARPQPSDALLLRVDRYLRRRKTLGIRLVVAGPEYVVVTVTATLTTVTGADATAVRQRALARLNGFIDPLTWPFGRDVFRAEILALLDGVDGVDAVTSLVLAADGEDEGCGNVCIGPTRLAVSGAHAVQVAA
jgi:hypothetical protein